MHFALYPTIPTVSYLEIPLLYKASMGNCDFNDTDAVQMLHSFMSLTEEYLKQFYPNDHTRDAYFAMWLEEQANLMLDNIRNHYDPKNGDPVVLSNPLSDILLTRIVNNILGKLKQYENCIQAREAFDRITLKWESLQ